MKPRDCRVYLHDALTAADAVLGFIEDRRLEQYLDDLLLRSAVERQFEVLGEALRRAVTAEAGLERTLLDSRGAIDFRNVIAHEYDQLADETVWDLARNELPPLRAALVAELARHGRR